MPDSEKNCEWEKALATLKKTKCSVKLSKKLGEMVWSEARKLGEPPSMPKGSSIEIVASKDVKIFMNHGLSGFKLEMSEQLNLL